MNKRALWFLAFALVVACFATAGAIAGQTAPPAGEQKPAAAAQQPGLPPPGMSPSQQAAQAARWAPNVRVDVTITDQGAPNTSPIKKTISVTANRNSSVRSGVNVPVPSTTFGSQRADGAPTPVTSYSYKTMGLSLDLRDVEVQDNLIRLNLTVEYSPLDDTGKSSNPAPATGLVSYSNFSQSFYLVLENGKPIIAAETSDPVPSRTRKLSVELKATVLK